MWIFGENSLTFAYGAVFESFGLFETMVILRGSLCLKKNYLFSFTWFLLEEKKSENFGKLMSIIFETYMSFEAMFMLQYNCTFISYMCGVVFVMTI